jgi:anti-sigma B factor antagonist
VLTIEPLDAGRGFRLAGDLDLATVPSLTQALEPALHQPGDLLLDLAEVGFIDSSGLRALIQAAMALRDRQSTGRLVLASPGHSVLRVLDLAGMSKVDAIEIRSGPGGEGGETAADTA